MLSEAPAIRHLCLLPNSLEQRENVMRDHWIASVGTLLVVTAVLAVLAGAASPPSPVVPAHEHPEYAKTSQLQGLATTEQLELLASVEELKATEVRLRDLIASLQDRIDNFDRAVEQHEKILSFISQPQGDVYVPRIEANMGVEDFDQEMARVVNRSVGGKSLVIIRNETSSTQGIMVNEDPNLRFKLVPGAITQVEVPTGNVTTRLDGQEVVNWAVGPPTYRQVVRIVPRGSVVTYRAPF
jgi:hypothetical protein